MDIQSINIEDYLARGFKMKHRGICQVCNMEVFWALPSLSNHKRTHCTISPEEKLLWPKDPVIPKPGKYVLSDYLETRNEITRRGACKVCGDEIFWSNNNLMRHKFHKCPIPEEERAQWKYNELEHQTTRSKKKLLIISRYLENNNISKNKGLCRICGVEVYWSNVALARHKLKGCTEAERNNEFWINYNKSRSGENLEIDFLQEEEDTQIVETTNEESSNPNEVQLKATEILLEFLKDKNVQLRRGTCKKCSMSVYWTVTHLMLHKLKKCPISELEKESWIILKEKLQESRNRAAETEVNIGEYLINKNIVTRRGTCKVCQTRVYWATFHLASHKKSKCKISAEEKQFWAKIKYGSKKQSIGSKEEWNVNHNASNDQLDDAVEEDDTYEGEESMNQTTFNDDVVMQEEEQVEEKLIPESPTFDCKQCDKKFKNKTYLLNHEKIHTSPYICNYCGKAFGAKHYLLNHITIHINNKTTEYKNLERVPKVGKLLDMFDAVSYETKENVNFEQVVIQHGLSQNQTEQENDMYLEENLETNQFECCRKHFVTFSDLARHQYTFHAEIFHMMIESMRTEITALLNSNENPGNIIKREVSDFEEEVENHENSCELSQDKISPNVNVECFLCEKELRALLYDKHLSIAHPTEDASRAKQATEKFICDCCGDNFNTISQCISHLNNARHQYSGTQCTICLQDFSSTREVNIHRRNHQLNIHTCETCQKSFKFANTLKLHQMSHRGMKPYYCPKCGYKSTEKENFDQHVLKHIDEPEHICPHCGKTFNGSMKLRRHIETHRYIEDSPVNQHICKKCSKEFVNKDKLQSHINNVHREKNFKCQHCPKIFISERLLENHMSVHTQEIKFFCNVCGNGYTRSSTLNKHIRTHDNSTLKYICDICSKAFREKTDLERHLKAHFGVRDHKCSECGEAFIYRYRLQRHSIKQHGHGLSNYRSTTINVKHK